MNTKSLIATVILGMTLTTGALADVNAFKDAPSQKAMQLHKRMSYAAYQAAAKYDNEKDKINAYIESMNSGLEGYKEAVMESCIANWGGEKAGACSCMSEKHDYALEFRYNALSVLTSNYEKDANELNQKTDAVMKECGLQ